MAADTNKVQIHLMWITHQMFAHSETLWITTPTPGNACSNGNAHAQGASVAL